MGKSSHECATIDRVRIIEDLRSTANGLKKNHDYLLYDDFIRGLIDSYSKIMGMNKEMIYEDLYTYYGNQTYDGKVRFLNI